MSQPMRPPDYFHFPYTPRSPRRHRVPRSCRRAACGARLIRSRIARPDCRAPRQPSCPAPSIRCTKGTWPWLLRPWQSNAATEVWLGLARVTVDKEQIAGTLLEDRLVALRHFVQDQPRYGVLLFNRGLYVDQALAVHMRDGQVWMTLLFLVGYDKIVQIFDPRYYDDRDAALQKAL